MPLARSEVIAQLRAELAEAMRAGADEQLVVAPPAAGLDQTPQRGDGDLQVAGGGGGDAGGPVAPRAGTARPTSS